MNKVKEYREHTGLTRQKLAEKLGIAYSGLYYIESGRNPSLPIAFKLANFFGVSIEELFPQFKDTMKGKTPAGV